MAPEVASSRAIVWIGATLCGALLLATLALWARYGGAIFVDMIATAWAYCF